MVMCEVQRTTWRSWLSPLPVGPGDWTQLINHGGKCLDPRSHLACYSWCFFFLYFLIFKTSVFRISCNTFWAHSPPFSIPPESTFPFLSTQCIVSSFLFNPANVICAASIVGGVAFHCSVIDLPEATFLKKTDFLSLSSYQLPIDFHLEGESLCSSPLAKLRFCLAWVCAGFFFLAYCHTTVCFYEPGCMHAQLRAECPRSLILCALTSCESLY